jgi:hypothetical protein
MSDLRPGRTTAYHKVHRVPALPLPKAGHPLDPHVPRAPPALCRHGTNVAALWEGVFQFVKDRESLILGVWAAPGAAQTPKMTDFLSLIN